MKLIYCLDCNDVVALSIKSRSCHCEKSGGRYIDKRNVEIFGNCTPIGIDNMMLSRAIEASKKGWHSDKYDFKGFIIKEPCCSIKRINSPVAEKDARRYAL